MAEAILRLIRDAVTGRLELLVGLRPDPDGVPSEHERDHKRLLGRLLPSLDLRFPEDGPHAVEREQIAAAPALG
jgi:hypothetical protein